MLQGPALATPMALLTLGSFCFVQLNGHLPWYLQKDDFSELFPSEFQGISLTPWDSHYVSHKTQLCSMTLKISAQARGLGWQVCVLGFP